MGTIRVTCKADTFLPFQQIQDFQGELKSRSQEDVDHLITSIERHGFSFPFFVWKQPSGTCSCLDGHGRILALKQLEREGWEIPELPVIYIEAQNEVEARTKLIHINVVSGKFTDVGFRDLVKDIPDLDLADFNYPELDLEKLDAELKILEQAQNAIQAPTDMSWDGLLDENSFAQSEFGNVMTSTTPNDTVPAGGSIPGMGDGASPVVIGGDSEGADSHDEGEGEDDTKELVVFCPECGERFIYQYSTNKESKEGDQNER